MVFSMTALQHNIVREKVKLFGYFFIVDYHSNKLEKSKQQQGKRTQKKNFEQGPFSAIR